MKKIFTLWAVMTTAFSVSAQDFEVGGIYYSINYSTEDPTCGVTYKPVIVEEGSTTYYYGPDYSGYIPIYKGDIVVPATVENDGVTYTVTSINYSAFSFCPELMSVTLPNTVTSIDSRAFMNCTGLTEFNLTNTITNVGSEAFKGCTDINKPLYNSTFFAYLPNGSGSEYRIPDGISQIVSGALSDCLELATLILPSSITEFNENPFSGCLSLKEIKSEGGNFVFENNCLLNKDKTELLAALDREEFEIPATVTTISNYAFSGCSGMKTIDFPNSITTIGMYAFFGCDGLEIVELPSSLKHLDWGVFADCQGLKTLYLPRNLEYMGNFICIQCRNIKEIYMPLKNIDINTFESHSTDLKIYVPRCWVNYYKEQIWMDNIYLNQDMILPMEVYFVGDQLQDENLNEYIVTSEEDNGTCALTKMRNAEGEVQILENIYTVTVNAIRSSAVGRNAKLLKVSIPKTITNIESKAFNGCTKLNTVHIYAEELQTYEENVFKASEDLKIYVPDASVEIYKSGWTELADCIFPMSSDPSDINNIVIDTDYHQNCINLQGVRVSGFENPGIYVKNGKKILVK